MFNKIRYLARLKEDNWELNRMLLYVKATGALKNIWIVISIWGLMTLLPMLIVLKIKWTIPFVVSLLTVVISSIVIQRKGSLFTKYIHISIGSLYLTFMMYYQFYIVSFYSDNATITPTTFFIYTIVFIILIISSPFFTYKLAKYEFEDENPNVDKRKKPPKFITYTVLLLGSGSILVLILHNFFPLEFQFSLFRVGLFFIMYMFLLTANSSLINAYVVKNNDKNIGVKQQNIN